MRDKEGRMNCRDVVGIGKRSTIDLGCSRRILYYLISSSGA